MKKIAEYAMKYGADIVITGVIMVIQSVVSGSLRKATTKAAEDITKDSRRVINIIRQRRSQAS